MIRVEPIKGVMPIVLAGAAFLVLLDVVGELTGRPLGIPYASLGVVSVIVYLAVGALGAWRANFITGVLAATIVGFVDGTFGPLAAWLMGHGPVEPDVTNPRVFVYGIVVVTAIAAAVGILGALAGSWLERRRGIRDSRALPR